MIFLLDFCPGCNIFSKIVKSWNEQIENPHRRNDGLLSDYCDAEAYRTHPLFSRNPKALQIILYFDEVEICNALGSKVIKHKLGRLYMNYLTFCINIDQ